MAAMHFKLTHLFGLLIALVLTGCVGVGGTFAVDRFLYKDISGDTFGACKARSYQAWARHKAWVQVNYAGAAELAERAEMAAPELGVVQTFVCSDEAGKVMRMSDAARKDTANACACGNALVLIERWSCAGPDEDKDALKRRLDAQAAACEGR